MVSQNAVAFNESIPVESRAVLAYGNTQQLIELFEEVERSSEYGAPECLSIPASVSLGDFF
jgi:hypothetical protein